MKQDQGTSRRNLMKTAIGATAIGVVSQHAIIASANNPLGCASSVLDFDDGSNDIGAWINSATGSGCIHIYIPPGTYTQKTPLTTNQEGHLYTTNYSFYGYNPVTINKDPWMFASPHIDTDAPFSSLGINWDGDDVSSDADGLVLRGPFEFIGKVERQSGHGLVSC